MDSLKGIQCFVIAVEEGSIAAAGRRLGISAAATSQNIARLEASLGFRLLRRSTRQLALTEGGQAYLDRVRGPLRELEGAREVAGDLQQAPRGRLRVASSVMFARHVLAPMVADYLRSYPEVSVELVVADRSFDHVREDIDVSIRYDEQLKASLIARSIGKVPFVYCVAPVYLETRKAPRTPAELAQHTCLVFRSPVDGQVLPWMFSGAGTQIRPDFGATMVANDGDTLTELAISGAGIVRLPHYVADPLIHQGRLVAVLSQVPGPVARKPGSTWPAEHLAYFACFQDRADATPRVRLFLDRLLKATSDHASFFT